MVTWLKTLVVLSSLSSTALMLSACGGDSGLPPLRYDSPLTKVYAYRPDAPVSSVALTCVRAEKVSQSCSLATLAPIAFTQPMPTIESIMDRLLVSDDWMGERFEAMLTRMPDDIVYLLGGVTAVVIGDGIRPSYYTNLTGAIYLDPANLWLTQEERVGLSTALDFRAAFMQQMNFLTQWRYVPDPTPSDTDVNRTLEQIEPNFAALLFHELAHANDFFPRSQYDSVDTSQSFLAVTTTINERANNPETLAQSFISNILTSEQGLSSVNMKRIAAILYSGAEPTANDLQITAAEVGANMAGDGANDDYGYQSQYEDLAMLFEEAMMKLHYSVDRDIAFLNWPSASIAAPSCDDYTVGWGMRNRLGDDLVLPRARWVSEQLLPHRDYSLLFDTFESPALIPVGMGWCASETFDSVQAAHFEKSAFPAVRRIPFNYPSPRSELRLY